MSKLNQFTDFSIFLAILLTDEYMRSEPIFVDKTSFPLFMSAVEEKNLSVVSREECVEKS